MGKSSLRTRPPPPPEDALRAAPPHSAARRRLPGGRRGVLSLFTASPPGFGSLTELQRARRLRFTVSPGPGAGRPGSAERRRSAAPASAERTPHAVRAASGTRRPAPEGGRTTTPSGLRGALLLFRRGAGESSHRAAALPQRTPILLPPRLGVAAVGPARTTASCRGHGMLGAARSCRASRPAGTKARKAGSAACAVRRAGARRGRTCSRPAPRVPALRGDGLPPSVLAASATKESKDTKVLLSFRQDLFPVKLSLSVIMDP
uniref:uncharacterized protein LOC129513618 n=1 Tax=Nyctereutes procyonoides TaxID=34880 RepID=UPI002444484A|nr:uncharacterized protein LOC129513618 [Nyctereutes procyonoides]